MSKIKVTLVLTSIHGGARSEQLFEISENISALREAIKRFLNSNKQTVTLHQFGIKKRITYTRVGVAKWDTMKDQVVEWVPFHQLIQTPFIQAWGIYHVCPNMCFQ